MVQFVLAKKEVSGNLGQRREEKKVCDFVLFG